MPNISVTPFPRPTRAAESVAEGTTIAGFAAGLALGPTGVGGGAAASAMLAARVGLILRMAQCGPRLDQPLSFYESPTGVEMTMGSDVKARQVRFYAGGLVMNLVILICWGVLALTVAALHFGLARPASWDVSFAFARIPGLMVAPCLFFGQPLVSAAITCIVRGAAGAIVVGIIGLVVVLATIAATAYTLLGKRRFWATFRTTEERLAELELLEDTEQGVYVKYVEAPAGTWYDIPQIQLADEAIAGADDELFNAVSQARPTLPLEDLTDPTSSNHNFVRRFGAFFDQYRGDYYWFILAETFALFILGIGDAIIILVGCTAARWVIVAVFAIYMVLLIVLAPHNARVDKLIGWAVAVLELVAAVLAAMVKAGDSDMIERAAIVASLALFVGLGGALLAVVADGVKYLADVFSRDRAARSAVATKIIYVKSAADDGDVSMEPPSHDTETVPDDSTPNVRRTSAPSSDAEAQRLATPPTANTDTAVDEAATIVVNGSASATSLEATSPV